MSLNVVETLRNEILSALGPRIQGREVALIDFPNHSNCGDSAIWVGEKRLLSELGCRVVYSCDTSSYRAEHIRQLPRKPVLLVHGGGNLGDLSKRHHRLRLALVRDFPDHEIIQLPQSVRFEDQTILQHTKEVFEAHPRITLFLRDRQSLAFCAENFAVASHLCPDSAFMMELRKPVHARQDLVVLARQDNEATEVMVRNDLVTDDVTDWLEDGMPVAGKLLRRFGKVPRWAPRHLVQTFRTSLQDRLAEQTVMRGAVMLATGRSVVTDRLHAHIFCELMGIPNVAVDTGYGKISQFHQAWMTGSQVSRMAGSFEEALELLRNDGRIESLTR